MITYEIVHRLFDYNTETGELIRKIKTSNRVKIGDVAGSIISRGYRHVLVNGKHCKVHRIVWLYHNGYIPESGIDHINRNPADNRIENLREVSQQCNMRNAKVPNTNKSGVKGIHWDKQHRKWLVEIAINRKNHKLGRFNDFDEAVCHRLAAEQCLGWNKCDADSSAYKYLKEKEICRL